MFFRIRIELVDCDKVDAGCNGGYMTDAYGQIISMGGLMTEEDYKYEGKQHNQCLLDKSKIKVNIDSYVNITSDENGKEIDLFLIDGDEVLFLRYGRMVSNECTDLNWLER